MELFPEKFRAAKRAALIYYAVKLLDFFPLFSVVYEATLNLIL
jgi:hypothetical protein